MSPEELREMRQDVKELVKQGAIHNELLRTHEARSLELQSRQDELSQRLEPISKHVDLVTLILKLIGGVSLAVASAVAVKAVLSLVF
jgi:hypothetical protein